MILKDYIIGLLKEEFSYDKLSNLSKRLNNLTLDHKDANADYQLYYDIIKVVDEFNLKKIGAGVYRKAYAVPGENWILKFAYGHNDTDYLYALDTIEEEINISQGNHGMGPRDIFVQVYDWDKVSDKPAWIITEKVITLSKASKIIDEESLRNIFPTFWNSLTSDSIEKSSKGFFCDFVADTLNEMSINTSGVKNKSGLKPKDFYLAMKEASIREDSLKPFEDVKFNLDFYRIAQACAYSRPDDMHTGNIGIVASSNPSPEDIVILDYMIDI